MIKKHIFIPGNARCGTTWVTRWLDELPQISCLYESYILYSARKMLNAQRRPSPVYVKKKHVLDFMDNVFEDFAQGKEIILDKSPGEISVNGEHVSDFIHSLYPDAYVMIFYRDGKNWVNSLRNLPWDKSPSFTVQQAVDLWIEKMETILASTPEKTLYIKYEDLLYSHSCRDILKFLGIEHDMLVPWTNPCNTKFQEHDPLRWQSMPKNEIKLMEKMNPMLEKSGYSTI